MVVSSVAPPMAFSIAPLISSIGTPKRAASSRLTEISKEGVPSTRSAYTSLAPGTFFKIPSTSTASAERRFRSGPKIFTATGPRIPVLSIRIRLSMGCRNAGTKPGNCCILCNISARSFSIVMPCRHSETGLSMIVVSIMEIGAGSVAESARPSLPTTLSTSGKDESALSWADITRLISGRETLGSVVGMKSMARSFRGGMKSQPMVLPRPRDPSRITAAIPITIPRWSRAHSSTGL